MQTLAHETSQAFVTRQTTTDLGLFGQSDAYDRATKSISTMTALEDIDGLSECIGRAIQEHLAKSDINIAWPQIDSLNHPILRIEAFLEEAGPHDATRPPSERVASVCTCIDCHRTNPLQACNIARYVVARSLTDTVLEDTRSGWNGDSCTFTKFHSKSFRL